MTRSAADLSAFSDQMLTISEVLQPAKLAGVSNDVMFTHQRTAEHALDKLGVLPPPRGLGGATAVLTNSFEQKVSHMTAVISAAVDRPRPLSAACVSNALRAPGYLRARRSARRS